MRWRGALDGLPSGSLPLLLLVAAMLFVSSTNSQPVNDQGKSDNSLESLRTLRDKVARNNPAGVILKYVKPVISGMKHRRSDDTRFVTFLDSMHLKVDPSPTRYPNAWAFDNEKSGAGISLDTWYIEQQESVATVATLLQMLQMPDQKLFERVMVDYLQACVDARKAGSRAPELSFNLQQYGISDLARMTLAPLIDDNLAHFVAFVILHEIGHVYSGHAGKSFANNSDSIDAELAADLWAIRALHEMDYSLGTVALVIGVKQVMELSLKSSGFDTGSPKHPTWAQRLNQVDAFNKQNLPRSSKWIALRGLSLLANDAIEVSYDLNVFLESRPIFEQLSSAVVSFRALNSRWPSLKPEHFMFSDAVAQWGDNSVTVRFRNGDSEYVLTISDPSTHDQDGNLSFESPNTPPGATILLRFGRFGHGLATEDTFEGMRLGELAEYDTIDFQVGKLYALGVEPLRVERVTQSLKEHRKDHLQLLLAYNTGDLSRSELQSRLDKLNVERDVRVEAIVGRDTFVRLQRAVDASIGGQVRRAIKKTN